jgi:H+/Na+-translocating ferredoxin:NAD+ oxidoreductase subunit E
LQSNRSYSRLVRNGIFAENPIFRVALSLCPAVAVTNGVKNGFLMGIAVLFVQVMANVTVSFMRKFIHPRVRLPSYMFLIATWVTVIDLVMAAFTRDVYKQMGLYIQLIVAFAIILSRAELFASKNKVAPSFFDGLGMGIGFLFALVVISFFRELFGKGSLWGAHIVDFKPLLIMILPTGGFFAVGLLMGLFNWIDIRFFGGGGASGGGH